MTIQKTSYQICALCSANRMWSGLIRDYYLPRASIYVKYLNEALHKNTSFAFLNWRREWISLTNEWQAASNQYPTTAEGDAVSIAVTLYEKYDNLIIFEHLWVPIWRSSF